MRREGGWGGLTIPVCGSTLRERVSTATTCALWVFQAQYFRQFAIDTARQEYSKVTVFSKSLMATTTVVVAVVVVGDGGAGGEDKYYCWVGEREIVGSFDFYRIE